MVSRPVTLLSFLFLISIQMSYAQGKQVMDMTLEELLEVKVVTANKREVESIKVAALVTVLTANDLAKGGAENLGDGLRLASGVNIRKAPGSLPQYNTSIRGNVSDFMNMRTLFLIDGVPVKNINAGFDPGWIPLSMINRVEIVKGPNSNLWGANAFGGVINVITKRSSDLKSQWGDAGIGYQLRHDHVTDKNVDGYMGSFNVGKKVGTFDYFASGQFNQANESAENYTGHKYQDVFGSVAYAPNEKVALSLRSLVSRDQNQIGSANAEEPIKNNFTHVAASADVKLDAESTLRFTPYLNVFDHDLNYTDELQGYENQATSLGLNSQYTTRINDLHSLVAGLDLVAENGLLDTKSFDYSSFPPTVQSVGWERKYQSALGTYFQYEYEGWEKFQPTVGLRYDNNSLFGDALSPRLSLTYLINRNTSVYTSIGRGFRAPVFNETYINGYGKIGDEDLDPEIITTYEIGFKNVQSRAQNSLAFFTQHIHDKIVLEFVDKNDPASLQTYRNVGSSKVYGVEFEGAYHFTNSAKVFYNSTLLKSDDGHGEMIERFIETKFVLGLDYTWNTWSFWIAGIQEGSNFYYNTNDDIPDDSKNRFFIPKQITGHVELTKRLGTSTLNLFVNNFTNLKYRQTFSSFEEQNGAILPGRRVGLMFKTQF